MPRIGSMLAQPDMGQSNMRDYADHYARICGAVELPVYVDADTGFGGVNNVRQMVRAFEAAGVAGVFISDQVFPNRCGYLPGKQVIPVEQMLAKIKAALDARRDPDFFICGRTDAAGVEGLNAAIERSQLFMEAGADMAKPMGVDTIDDIKRVMREVGGPHMATLSQAAGLQGAKPRRTRGGRRGRGDVPLAGAVRRRARGAQRAAHPQAREFADRRHSIICCRSTIITSWSGSRSCWRARKATTRRPRRSCISAPPNSRRPHGYPQSSTIGNGLRVRRRGGSFGQADPKKERGRHKAGPSPIQLLYSNLPLGNDRRRGLTLADLSAAGDAQESQHRGCC